MTAEQQFSDDEVLDLCKSVVTTSLDMKNAQIVGS